MKNTKKTMITVALGALVLTAPIASIYAADEEANTNKYKKVNPSTKLEFMQDMLNIQIEHANKLVGLLDESDEVDKDRINSIIIEFSELEYQLSEFEYLNESQKDDLKEIFFETHKDSKELSYEFRSLIMNAFSESEREEFRNQFKSERDNLRDNYGIPDKNHGEDKGPKFTIEQIKVIDSDIGSALENEEITMQEAMGELKKVIHTMDSQDRKELFDSLGIEKPHKSNSERKDISKKGFRNN